MLPSLCLSLFLLAGCHCCFKSETQGYLTWVFHCLDLQTLSLWWRWAGFSSPRFPANLLVCSRDLIRFGFESFLCFALQEHLIGGIEYFCQRQSLIASLFCDVSGFRWSLLGPPLKGTVHATFQGKLKTRHWCEISQFLNVSNQFCFFFKAPRWPYKI